MCLPKAVSAYFSDNWIREVRESTERIIKNMIGVLKIVLKLLSGVVITLEHIYFSLINIYINMYLFSFILSLYFIFL
jgi:hypothetical protein